MTDRDRLIEFLHIAPLEYAKKEKNDTRMFVEFYADYLLANGVIVPVRCKDCVYFISNQNLPNGYDNAIGADGLCDNTDTYTYEDDYCSCAKLKECEQV